MTGGPPEIRLLASQILSMLQDACFFDNMSFDFRREAEQSQARRS